MKILDGIRMAAGGLRERKMRTALTLMGIVIGTSMIVALEASTQGQSAAISSQLEKLGPTTLLVRAQGQNAHFTSNDLATMQGLDNVKSAFLTVEGDGQITRSGETDNVAIVGISPTDLPTLVRGLVIQDGQPYPDGDLTSGLLGSAVAVPTDTTKPPVGTGDTVQVAVTVRDFSSGRGVSTTVTRTLVLSGVAAPFGSAPFVDVDNTIFMTPQAAQQLMKSSPSNYNQIVVIADTPDNVQAVQNEIQATFTNARVLSGTQIASTISGVYNTISTLLSSIAAISLIVAGVGIANTMFVSVIERTTEIGTLKALGFKAREVLGVFLLEASITGVIGGILGCLFGVGVAFGIGRFISFSPTGNAAAQGARAPAAGAAGGAAARAAGGAGRGGGGGFGGGPGGFGGGGGGFGTSTAAAHASPVFTFSMFAIVILFAIVVAVIAGYIPARKAAKLDPVIALKRL